MFYVGLFIRQLGFFIFIAQGTISWPPKTATLSNIYETWIKLFRKCFTFYRGYDVSNIVLLRLHKVGAMVKTPGKEVLQMFC